MKVAHYYSHVLAEAMYLVQFLYAEMGKSLLIYLNKVNDSQTPWGTPIVVLLFLCITLQIRFEPISVCFSLICVLFPCFFPLRHFMSCVLLIFYGCLFRTWSKLSESSLALIDLQF